MTHPNNGSLRPSDSDWFLRTAALAALHRPACEVAALRRTIEQQCPRFVNAGMIRFVQQAFARDDMVEAYFWPRVVADQTGGSPAGAPHSFMPFEEALRAAHMAQHMDVLEAINRFYRQLAGLAALLYPCGRFMQAHPALRPAQLAVGLDHVGMRQLSIELLEPALLEMRGSQIYLSHLLTTALGFNSGTSSARELASRLSTAVHLANARITFLWSPR